MKKQLRDITSLLAQILPENLPEHLEPLHRRRLEIILRTYMGQSQTEICSALGCSKDMARHWMSIAKREGLNCQYEQPVGRPRTVDDRYLRRLGELVTSSPQEYGYAFNRWTANWLSKHLAQELGIQVSDRHVNRLLKKMGLSTSNRGQKPTSHKSSIKGNIIVIDDLNPSSLSS